MPDTSTDQRGNINEIDQPSREQVTPTGDVYSSVSNSSEYSNTACVRPHRRNSKPWIVTSTDHSMSTDRLISDVATHFYSNHSSTSSSYVNTITSNSTSTPNSSIAKSSYADSAIYF